MYKLIFVDVEKAPDDILMKQLGMLKERNKAKIIGVGSKEVSETVSLGNIFDEFLACNDEPFFTTIQRCLDGACVPVNEALVIGEYPNEENTYGFKLQRPSDMVASYKKAMELLRGGIKRE